MHNHGYFIAIAIAAISCFSSATAVAVSINVDFGPATPAYSGVAAATDTGTHWNRVSNGLVNVLNLADSGGNPTAVGIKFDTSSHGVHMFSHAAPQLSPDLMRDYLYTIYPNTGRFWINNLVSGRHYDLILYSQNGDEARGGTKFTVNGVEQTVKNPGNFNNFILSEGNNHNYGNYVRFSNVVADADGRIDVSYEDALGFAASVNGFQLTELQTGNVRDNKTLGAALLDDRLLKLYVTRHPLLRH